MLLQITEKILSIGRIWHLFAHLGLGCRSRAACHLEAFPALTGCLCNTTLHHAPRRCKCTPPVQGRLKKLRRSATVEPVLGTLLNFHRMKKVYTIGQELAGKQFLMAAAAYNLKKLMSQRSRKYAMSAVSTAKTALAGINYAVNAAKTLLLDEILACGKFIFSSNKIFAMQ